MEGFLALGRIPKETTVRLTLLSGPEVGLLYKNDFHHLTERQVMSLDTFSA